MNKNILELSFSFLLSSLGDWGGGGNLSLRSVSSDIILFVCANRRWEGQCSLESIEEVWGLFGCLLKRIACICNNILLFVQQRFFSPPEIVQFALTKIVLKPQLASTGSPLAKLTTFYVNTGTECVRFVSPSPPNNLISWALSLLCCCC